VSIPPTPARPRPIERKDPDQPPARGTRGAGYGDAAGAPPGAVRGAAEAAPAPFVPSSKGGPRTPPAPAAGQTVRKHAAEIPAAPVPAAFPPPELTAACEALLARYPRREAALIPILHLAQRHYGGWVSPEVEAGVGRYLGLPDQHVRGVLTFYTMFNTKPVGRHHLQVCRTLSCWLRGAGDLTRRLRERTGLAPGETDAEGRFTVTEVECLGLCEVAPALFVNETAHESVTPEKLDALLDGLR
jgi:NADH-quinone oxidoreductase subunit E